jgi:hypothetical protein
MEIRQLGEREDGGVRRLRRARGRQRGRGFGNSGFGLNKDRKTGTALKIARRTTDFQPIFQSMFYESGADHALTV